MRLGDLRDHFHTKADWIPPDHRGEAIHVGSADDEARRIGTGWVACATNLRAAAADGCDLFISHEHPFASDAGVEHGRRTAWGRQREAICREAGMALMHQHDTWDHWPVYGMRDSWARHLGLGEPTRVLDYANPNTLEVKWGRRSLGIYETAPTTLDAYARRVAGRCRELRTEGVTVTGDPAAKVRTVAIGVGCHIPSFECREAGADVLIQVYDRALQTTVRIPLAELGANVIVVEHGTAEIPAMRDMARYLNETFEEVEATFYCREPISRVVTP